MGKGHVFQDECWEGHASVGVHLSLLWLRRLAKALKGIFGTFIYKNKGN